MTVQKMSDTAAAVVFGSPVTDYVDSPLFHEKLLAADTVTPSLERAARIAEMVRIVEAEYAAVDEVIAAAVAIVKRSLADINDPALFVWEGCNE